MKQKLFENVGGNQFKLITESVEEINPKAKLVREGVKKVFTSGDKELSYKRIGSIGMGYIKDVSEARKCAVQEAKELASEFGYKDDESSEKFVKAPTADITPVAEHGEGDMSNPEEAREVQIGKEILSIVSSIDSGSPHDNPQATYEVLAKITSLAQELVKLHGAAQ